MQPVRDAEELERAFGEPWALVFKHSTRCPASRSIPSSGTTRLGAPTFLRSLTLRSARTKAAPVESYPRYSRRFSSSPASCPRPGTSRP